MRRKNRNWEQFLMEHFMKKIFGFFLILAILINLVAPGSTFAGDDESAGPAVYGDMAEADSAGAADGLLQEFASDIASGGALDLAASPEAAGESEENPAAETAGGTENNPDAATAAGTENNPETAAAAEPESGVLAAAAPVMAAGATAAYDFGFVDAAVQMTRNGVGDSGDTLANYLRNPDNLTAANNPNGAYRVYLARNEHAGFQTVYREKTLTGATIALQVSDFAQTGGGARISPQVFREEYMENTYPDTAHPENPNFVVNDADPLTPYGAGTPVASPLDECSAFYIELRTAVDTPAGDYTGTVTVNIYDRNNALAVQKTLPVTVTVWNFYLPDNHFCRTAMGLLSSVSGYSASTNFLTYSGVGLNPDGTVKPESLPLAQKVVKAYYDLLLDNGVSAYDLPYTPIDLGTDFGYVKDAKAAELYMSDPRVTSFVLQNTARMGYDMTAPAAQAKAYSAVVSKQKLWQDKSYFYLTDEAKAGWIDQWGPTYHDIIHILNSAWTDDPNTNYAWPAINAVSPVNGDVAYNVANLQRGYNNNLCISIQNFYEGESADAFAAVKEWQNAGKQVWTYPDDAAYGGYFDLNRKNSYNFNIGMSMGVARRSMFWSAYNFGMTGVLYWIASGWMHNPWSDNKIGLTGVSYQSGWGNGNGALIYPPKPGTDPAAPIASLRLKQINSGLYDYDYLTLARQFIDGGDRNGSFVGGLLAELGMKPDSGLGFTKSIDTVNDVRMKIGAALDARFKAGADYQWGPWVHMVDGDATHNGMDVRVDSLLGAQQSRESDGVNAQVTFDSQGGSAVAPVAVPLGGKIPAPADPKLDGSVFKGWYFNGAPVDLKSYTVTGDTPLTARWGPDPAKIKISDRISAGRANHEQWESNYSYGMAIDKDNRLWAWGDNSNGQLGDGTTAAKNAPAIIMSDAAEVTCGMNTTAVIKTDGTLWMWGLDVNSLQPVYIADNVKSVSLASGNGAYVRTTGALYAFGGGYWGNIGTGDQAGAAYDAPRIPMYMSSGVKKVSVGYMNMYALRNDGSLWAWGWGALGQIGDGANSTFNIVPKQIMSGVADVTGAMRQTLAIKTDGSLWAWGTNTFGQFGDGSKNDSYSPVKIGDGYREVVCGQKHTAVIKTDGSLWTFGYNAYGQIGNGKSGADQPTPVKILDNIAGAACGWYNTFAVKQDGSLWGWGLNNNRQLGDRDLTTGNALAAGYITSPVMIMPQGTIIAYTPKTYTVTFDAQGGTPVPPSQAIAEGAKVTRPANPGKTGAVFKEWLKNG
ncbi:MAG: InlB B-repeat-containing protein, partial [Firmicutes bacterium]|nr:InlB B-repeat-containing protein [Bacillota bacterium]